MKLLINKSEIQSRISELAKTLNKSLVGSDVLFVGVLHDSFIFYADLIRQIEMDVKCEFIVDTRLDEIPFDVSGKTTVMVFGSAPSAPVVKQLREILNIKGARNSLIYSFMSGSDSTPSLNGCAVENSQNVIGYGIGPEDHQKKYSENVYFL